MTFSRKVIDTIKCSSNIITQLFRLRKFCKHKECGDVTIQPYPILLGPEFYSLKWVKDSKGQCNWALSRF